MASELSREQVFKALRTEYGPNRTVAHHLVECVSAADYHVLRQQLEQSQQLVTDGQEAIGHWQDEYEQLRQIIDEISH